MAVIDDIREQQKKAMHEMDWKGKLAYFWYYYKVHTIVAIVLILFIASFIYQYATNKDYGFYAAFLNASITDYTIEETWANEFTEYAQIDTDEYEVYIDTSIQLNGEMVSQYTLSSQEKLFAMVSVGEVSAIVADSETFESYARNDFFYDLETVLSPEDLEKYKDYFYYTDAAYFDMGDDDTFYTEEEQAKFYEQTLDHRSPSEMERPVAVGICITDADKIKESGYYDYLEQNDITFQGFSSEAVLGIPLSVENPDLTVRFLEYLGLGETDAEAVTPSAKTAELEDQSAETTEPEDRSAEIPIDYPFPNEIDYTAALAPIKAQDGQPEGQYEVLVRDGTDHVIQRLPCGKLIEPIEFSYYSLNDDWREDLEIFTTAESDGSSNGLLFLWDSEKNLFREDGLKIPVYDTAFHGYGFLTVNEDEARQEKTIYQLDEDTDSFAMIRSWNLSKDSGMLTIEDGVTGQTLFEGQVKLKEDKTLLNEEYYDELFRYSLPLLTTDTAEEEPIRAWLYGDDHGDNAEYQENMESFEKIQEAVFGNEGHSAEYPDKETFLKDFGCYGKTPFYTYYDRLGRPELELYLDEAAGNGCGICYSYYRYLKNQGEMPWLNAFTFHVQTGADWTAPDPYSLKTYDGQDVRSETEDYEEFIEYMPDGQLASYQLQSFIDELADEEDPAKRSADTLLSIRFLYRDDGTLYRRVYSHNGFVFGTTYQSMSSYYDERGRLVYENCYITHGSLDYYYIYTDDSQDPAYCLEIDHNLDTSIPFMVKY